MSRVIKAAKLVQGQEPVTIATSWSVAGWEEIAATSDEGSEVRLWNREGAGDPGEPADPSGEDAAEPEGPDPEAAAKEALAQEQAAAITAAAETEAARVVEEAQAKAAAILDEARETGYQAGHTEGLARGEQEGRAKAEAELAEVVKQAADVLNAAVREKNQILTSSRDDVLKIIRKIAEKIIRAEARLDPSIVERSIDASLRLVTERNQVLVRVNPEDVSRAREGLPNFVRYFTPSAVVEVCADPRVISGGCVIETNAGNVDAQLETQLEEVLGQLEERLYGG